MELGLATHNRAEVMDMEPEYSADLATRGVLRVLVGGMDNAGKSTLACSLYQSLQAEGFPVSLYEIDRWSDTHDCILGRKPWSQRSKNFEISVDDYARYAQIFAEDDTPIVIGDLEGRYQNEQYLSSLKGTANFGVLVTRESIEKDLTNEFPQTEQGWIELFKSIGVPINLKVHSRLAGQNVRFGSQNITGLERQSIPNHPGVKKIAHQLVNLCGIKRLECSL